MGVDPIPKTQKPRTVAFQDGFIKKSGDLKKNLDKTTEREKSATPLSLMMRFA